MKDTDRELLEWAAKAAGNGATFWRNDPFGEDVMRLPGGTVWAPNHDDGDALRLAVKMKLWVASEDSSTFVADDPDERGLVSLIEHHKGDPCAATRRAIVRAAAEIGKGMA